MNVVCYNKSSYIHKQARNQDRFWEGAEPPKVDLLYQKKKKREDLLSLTSLTLLQKPIFSHFVDKSGPFGRFGVVHRTSAHPGYGPACTQDDVLHLWPAC